LNWNDLPLEGPDSFLGLLSLLHDPRKPRGVRHRFVVILAISVGAVLSGAQSFEAIAQWGKTLSGETLKQLGSTRDQPPSESTFRKTLQRIDAEAMDLEISAWLLRHFKLTGQQVSLDGKTLRGSYDGPSRPLHLLSAILATEGVVLAQRAVGEKTNEIPEIKPLLAPLPLEGAIVTADAMHTQTETARYIVDEKKADYLLTVKDNQPTLKAEIESLGLRLMGSFSPSGEIAG
jgi:hypothetical protein